MSIMDFSITALKNLFSKPATSQYPAVPKEYPERSRGHVEIDIDNCIMCGICSRKCMSGAIKVDRATKTWSIERMGCVQCQACVNACPKKCLTMAKGYTEPSAEKTVDTYSQPIPEPVKTEEAPEAAAPAPSRRSKRSPPAALGSPRGPCRPAEEYRPFVPVPRPISPPRTGRG